MIEHVFEELFDRPEAVDGGPRAQSAPPRESGRATGSAGPAVATDEARTPPVHPLVAQLQSAVAALAQAQADGTLAAGSLVDTGALLRAAESVAGLALVEVAAVDRHKSFLDVGRASTAGWLGALLTITDQAARAKVSLSRRLTEDLSPLGDLLVEGGTTVGHCSATASGLRGIAPDVVAESLPHLVTLARHLDPLSIHRTLREKAHAVSPELAEEQERRQRQRVGCSASELPDGMVSVHALLAPEGGQAVLAALDALVHGERHARTADGRSDDRDASTRRADALVTLAQHALDCPGPDGSGVLPGQGGSRAQVHIVVQAETLLDDQPGSAPATFAGSNGLLTRQQLLRLTCDADISRVVLAAGDGADGEATRVPHTRASRRVLDLGRLTRTVTRSQYRALVARDQGCIVKGCRRRHTECQAHHVRHWALGGASDLDNFALVCHLHHHQLHEGRQRLQHRDGRWLTPDGYEQPPPEPPLF